MVKRKKSSIFQDDILQYIKRKKLLEDDLKRYALKEDFRGKGTEFNPLIITSSNFSVEPDNKTVLIDSKLFVTFMGINFPTNNGRLVLRHCRNVTFQNCTFSLLKLIRCSNVSAINCKADNLHLVRCESLDFNKCSFKDSIIYLSFGNKFKECRFDSAVNSHSRGNVFDQCEIHEYRPDIEHFTEGLDWRGLYFVSIFIVIAIIVALSLYNLSVFGSLYGISLLLLIELYLICWTIRNRMKAKKYLPNLLG